MTDVVGSVLAGSSDIGEPEYFGQAGEARGSGGKPACFARSFGQVRGARRYAALLVLASLCVAMTAPARAEQPIMPGASREVTPQAVPEPMPAVPAPEDLLALIRTTIIALNQANLTGNYTVLRDIGAPPFRSANDASKLSLIFKVLRDQNVDLSLVAQVTPELATIPIIDERGLLQLAGRFPTTPLSVDFQLAFARFGGRWQPYAITVNLVANEQRVTAAPRPSNRPVKAISAPALARR